MNQETTGPRFLGVVEPDSGTLLLSNPADCLFATASGRTGTDFSAIVAAPDEPGVCLVGRPMLLIRCFSGDGAFPVFADGDENGVVSRVMIEFVNPPEDE